MGVTGQTEQTGWTTQGEGFLVVVPSGGTITDRSQMVSDKLLPNVSSGFAALSAFDANGDSVITNVAVVGANVNDSGDAPTHWRRVA